MDWGGLSGVFTLAETDPSMIYLDQLGNSQAQGLIVSAQQYPVQVANQPVYDMDNVPSERFVFVDQHGNFHESYQDIGILTSLQRHAGIEDDGEIPPHALDHMYAKKPREPGSENVAKPRRRSKKKEQVVEPQYLIPDPLPQTPKINIIRQRLPSSVYKSLSPSRPKILQGGLPVKGGSQSPSGSLPRKDVSTRLNFSIGNRTVKKEDPSFTQPASYAAFGDDHSKNIGSKGLGGFGNGSKSAKDQNLLGKTVKPFGSKEFEDLNSKQLETEYEEEMLFDFGIAEDEDEVNRCALSSEEFNDVVFGEIGFEGGLEPYPIQNQSSCSKGSRLPNTTSSQRFFKKTGLSTAATLSSGISDDDDSNQIMVPMGNRRKSRDWDSIEKVEVKIEDVGTNRQVEEEDPTIPVLEPFNTENEKSSEPMAAVGTESNDSSDPLLITQEDYRLKDSQSESSESLPSISRTSVNELSVSKSKSVSNESKELINTSKSKRSTSTSISPSTKSTLASKTTPEPTRRSVRAIRAPARLDDIDDGSASKRKRR